MFGHFEPAIPSQRATHRRGELANMPGQSSNDSSRVFAGHFHQCDKTRMAFDQGGDVTVVGTAQQIALPMTGNGSVFDLRRPFPDGDGIDDLTHAVSTITRVPRAAYTPLGPKVLNQLFFQHSARLNEQTAINRFVGHAHALVVGILDLQPSRNLFRPPVQDQFTRNDRPQLPPKGEKAPLGSQGRRPRLVIGFMSSIERSPAMAGDLSTYRRNCPLQTFGYITNRGTGSDSSGDVFPLRQCERQRRASTDARCNPALTRQ